MLNKLAKIAGNKVLDLAKDEVTSTTTLIRSGCWFGMSIITLIIGGFLWWVFS